MEQPAPAATGERVVSGLRMEAREALPEWAVLRAPAAAREQEAPLA
jgi:hypothetical protein